jgi:23S rRNA (uracil-5-)-methyltransferase RumA
MKKGTILQDLQISDIAFGGTGIGKIPTESGDFVVFVENTIPGQTVSARIVKSKKRYADAKLIKIVKKSPDEIDLPYQRIPGAPFAAWPIEKQLEYKQKSTLEMFRRLGEMPDLENYFDEFISSPRIWCYRNKMEYSFSVLESDIVTQEETWGFALGFKRRGQWWAVEKMEKASGLFDEELENNMPRISEFCIDSGLPAWNPAKSNGFFRFLVVRKSFTDDELLFNLVTTSENIENFDINGFVSLLKDILGKRLAGVWHTVNNDIGDAAKQPADAAKLLYGKAKIREKILDLNFDISMQSFFQTNPASAELLYSKALTYVREALTLTKSGHEMAAMDLFCGTGTIAQLLSKIPEIKSIVGVDIVEEAIADAKENAALNNIDNIDFYAADAGKFLFQYPQYKDKIAVIVLDPPRAGIAPKTLQKVINLDAAAIVYVSCNPSTQARDAIELRNAGYSLEKLSFVDQFPHTSHIESVAMFIKKK